MIRMLIVDDNPECLQAAVKKLSAGDLIEVVGTAMTSDEAFQEAKKLLPDIVLLDLYLPGLLSLPALVKKLIDLPNVKIIAYAGEGKAAEVQELFEFGVSAYMLKSDPAELLRMSVLMVQRDSKGVVSSGLPRHITRISEFERAVLLHVTKRGGIPKAADRTGITEHELVETLEHLAEKLELDGYQDVIKWARKNGY
jgi:DNA-binding NarL/FixJ family response regulator